MINYFILFIMQTHCCAGWSRVEDISVTGQQEHCLGQLRRKEETGAVSWRQSEGDHQHLPHPLHLLPGTLQY